MLKPKQNPDDLLQKKAKCKCGRKVLVARKMHKSVEFLCSTCKTFGVEESRRMFLQDNSNSNKTLFSITPHGANQ